MTSLETGDDFKKVATQDGPFDDPKTDNDDDFFEADK